MRWSLQIETDGLLAASEGFEEQGVLVCHVRRHISTDVAARERVLDLDDLGSEVGKIGRAERGRAVLFGRRYADAFEWQTYTVGSS